MVMTNNRITEDTEKKPTGIAPVAVKEEPKKKEKHGDDDTRNSGFRSSRIRDAESRTSDTGDPSVS
jgi:hypothetical protein